MMAQTQEMNVDFPQDYADNDLADLDEMREDSYDEEYDEEKKQDDDGNAGGDDEFGDLGGDNMAFDGAGAEQDYVEVNVNDTRRSKFVTADVINQLSKQDEEKKRPSRAAIKVRQSFLL